LAKEGYRMAQKQIQKTGQFTRENLPLGEDAPALLKDYRLRSWEAYEELPYPTIKDEEWRRTNLRSLKLDALKLPNGQVDLFSRSKEQTMLDPLAEELKGGYAVVDAGGVKVNLKANLADQGVIFTDLLTAARDYPDLLEKGLGKALDPAEGKFAALTGAFAQNGIFVYVPQGVRLEQNLQSLYWASGEKAAHFSQLVIVLEKDSSLTYIHETSSDDALTQQALSGENVEVVVGPGSHLTFVELQTLGRNMWSFGHKKAIVHRDGNLDWVIGAVGSQLTKHFVSVDMAGKGANGQVSGLFFGDGKQHLSYNTKQNHLAPRSNSDLLFKGALTGSGRSVWRGMIYVAPEGQYIDGYQANRNLILSQKARSDSIPGLEILNNDVRCTHGSTVGKIDQEQLFYLQARGIPHDEAVRLIVHGFFEEIMRRIPLETVRKRLNQVIDRKLSWQA
jgi:Fe-S cluster assembly protein SufD